MYKAVPATDGGTVVHSNCCCIEGISGVLGLAALVTGAIYINTKGACSWSPHLPIFLLAYGIVNVCAPLLHVVVMIFWTCSKSDNTPWKSIACISFLFFASSLGLIVWGFALLYSNTTPVTYKEYRIEFGYKEINKNYCVKTIYLMSVMLSWSYVAVLGLCILCFVCVQCCSF